MTFDEFLKQNNVNTELMEFVDDDPYKKSAPDKQYDNIVDAYHDAKQFRPDDVAGLTSYSKLLDYLDFNKSYFDVLLNMVYESYPDGNLTDEAFSHEYVTYKLNDGTKASVYDLARQQGKQVVDSLYTRRFVEQFNELAKRVNDQASK